MELERIYGIRYGGKGGNRFQTVEERNNFVAVKSQQDLVDELGLEVRTMQNYKKLTTLIPELIDLVDTGIVTPTTALSIVKSMSDAEQEQFVAESLY